MRFLFITFFNPENLGVRSLGSVLQANGHEAHILQVKKLAEAAFCHAPEQEGWYYYIQGTVATSFLAPQISNKEYDLLAHAIKEQAPDVIGYSGMSTLDDKFPEFAKAIATARPTALLIAGGVGPTLRPEHYLRNGASIVMRGESEKSIVKLANALQENKDWHSIENLCYLKNDTLVCNPLAPLEEKLDLLGIPLIENPFFSFIDDDRYVPGQCLREQGNVYLLIGSRGCIGKCTYCSAPRMRKMYAGTCHSYIRKRSTSSILQELHEAKKFAASGVFFGDDFFVRPVQELVTFFKTYKEEINLPFSIYMHPQQLLDNPQIIDAAIEAGLRAAAFGLQHAGEHFCENIFKRKRFCNDYSKLVQYFLQRDIPVNFHLIEATPQETPEDFQENLNFVAQFPSPPSRDLSVQFHVMFLNYIEGSALLEDNPGINKIPRSTTNWAYHCLLLDIRQMVDDKEFSAIYSNNSYKEDVSKLWKLRNHIDDRRHLTYLLEQAKRLHGQEVYFFGAGAVYESRKHLFAGCHPLAMLVDKQFFRPQQIDGLQTAAPEIILGKGISKPVIMFARKKFVMKLKRDWRRKFPWMHDIVICTENLSQCGNL